MQLWPSNQDKVIETGTGPTRATSTTVDSVKVLVYIILSETNKDTVPDTLTLND